MRPLIFILLVFSKMVSGQNLDSLGSAYLKDFKETFKRENFEIGGLSINHCGEIVRFEISVIPKIEGVYFIKQIYEYEEGFGRKNNSLLSVIKTGEKETPRIFYGKEPNTFIGPSCTVGDTIIVPIYWNKHVVSNRFSAGEETEHESYGRIDSTHTRYKTEKRQLDWEVTNNISELKVLNVNSSYAIHRGLQDERVRHIVRFEAQKSGNFTLKIRDFEYPIIIHPSESSIQKRVSQVVGKQWDNHSSSYSLPSFYHKCRKIKHALVRVGDEVNVIFMEYQQEVANPKKMDLKLEINKMN